MISSVVSLGTEEERPCHIDSK